jgi:hypothetical protein
MGIKIIDKIVSICNKGLRYDSKTKALAEYAEVLLKENEELDQQVKELETENLLLNKQLIDNEQQETKLDQYLRENYTQIPNISYKNKREFKGKPISVTLQEMITPNAYEVQKVKKKIGLKKGLTNLQVAKKIGDKVSRILTWTDDKQLIKGRDDYYTMPNESLVYKKVDCEDHAFVNASMSDEIGVVYGFYKGGGHAWNCFVHNDQLYFLETTGNVGSTILASNAKDYEPSFIVTRKGTYKVGKLVAFGYRA